MKYLVLGVLCTLAFSAMSAEKRCGWLVNPTPANLWLIDGTGTWTISTQGTESINEDSMDKMPTIDEKEFVRTNGDYGFSCVCLSVQVDKKKSNIRNVYGGEQLLLKQCLEDPEIRNKVPLP